MISEIVPSSPVHSSLPMRPRRGLAATVPIGNGSASGAPTYITAPAGVVADTQPASPSVQWVAEVTTLPFVNSEYVGSQRPGSSTSNLGSLIAVGERYAGCVQAALR